MLERFEEQNPVVLVIDDSLDVHRLLRARLRQEDVDLIGASGGEAGLDAAAEHQPALILLDISMPGMDGFEVLRLLKQNPATMNIPVIVLSGHQSPQDKVTAFDLGAVDYMTKPFDLMELRVRVRSALRMHRLLQLLTHRAQIDGLTGLWNRSHFDKRWRDEVALCARHARPLSLAMLDLDHFKSINDAYGHPAGDAVLQTVARELQRACRQIDIPCRYGGEEFAIILPETAPDAAGLFCERIRAGIGGIVWPRHPERRVTISIGVAGSAAGAPPTAERWIECADMCLYRSKRAGRDRVTVHDFSASPAEVE